MMDAVNHKKTEFTTKESILDHGKNAVGMTVGEIDRYGRLDSDGIKGGVGHVIEESWYHYKPNSDAEPDFTEAGVELKVTGVIKDKKGDYKAKERLVLNIINFMDEVKNTFETGSFWHKNRLLMMFVYEYLKDRPRSEFPIIAADLFTYPEEDLVIIKDDWAKIVGKIRSGKAHEISEGDTLYLGACTKGATAATSLRKQPFSDIPAKQRAYCLKNRYVTYIIQTYILGKKHDERIIKDIKTLKENTFESYVTSKLARYRGWSIEDLKSEFNVRSKSKDDGSVLVFRILGVKGNRAEELEKAGVVVKTIRINQDGSITEKMSFPTFKFQELVKETWEDSTFANYLRDTRFLFIVYRYDENSILRLLGGQFWNMPYSDLEEEVRSVWERTKEIFQSGTLTVDIRKNRVYNNLPDSTQNRVSHVRPHGRNREDTYPLPEGTHITVNSTDGSYKCPSDRFTKQCFWLNNGYILSQLDERFKE